MGQIRGFKLTFRFRRLRNVNVLEDDLHFCAQNSFALPDRSEEYIAEAHSCVDDWPVFFDNSGLGADRIRRAFGT
jgi:hypothetical protein